MKKLLVFLILLCILHPQAAESLREVKLWPEGMPEPVVPADPPEKTEKGTDGLTRRWNVSQPRLFVHEPPAGVARTGAALVVVPGGGFGRLADEHEGSDAATFFARQGMVVFQLAYRTPTTKHPQPHLGPVQDVQRSVSMVRQLAASYQVQADKIGLLGFSAGGLSSLLAVVNDPLFPAPKAQASHKPDFLLLIYPHQLYDVKARALRSDAHIEASFPPTFIAQAGDDTGSLPQGSTLLYLQLINQHIPAEIHIYEKGGHGFGMRPRPNATGPTDWPERASDWLRARQLVNPR